MMQSKQVIISGRVQGVSYRAWTREQARARGLTGWVRNLPDGSVEALVQGEEQAVASLLEALWQGPPAASVNQVQVSDTTAPAHATFEVTQ